jgi:hypothetical protein
MTYFEGAFEAIRFAINEVDETRADILLLRELFRIFTQQFEQSMSMHSEGDFIAVRWSQVFRERDIF